MSSNLSSIPEVCPNCTGQVKKKICGGCGNTFGTGASFKERRKNGAYFPQFSKGEIDKLRRKDDLQCRKLKK